MNVNDKPAHAPAAIRHVILDRDGVLNREAPGGGWMHRAKDWVWEPNALEGLCRLTANGIRISVATNQSGVGRGVFPSTDVEAVHERMFAEATKAGVRIDAVFVCSHSPQTGCACRKPAPGLIEQAVEASDIPIAETIMVGDALRDLEAARNAGVRAVLVRTGKGRITEEQLEFDVEVYDDLLGIANSIVPVSERVC